MCMRISRFRNAVLLSISRCLKCCGGCYFGHVRVATGAVYRLPCVGCDEQLVKLFMLEEVPLHSFDDCRLACACVVNGYDMVS